MLGLPSLDACLRSVRSAVSRKYRFPSSFKLSSIISVQKGHIIGGVWDAGNSVGVNVV